MGHQDMNKDPSEMMLESSRFWIQKVLVPIMVCIGVTGNTITVMVLTRSKNCLNSSHYTPLDATVTPTACLLPKSTQELFTGRRMRSSTNIYLSALAIADIIHLFFVFLLSFKHYNNIHDRRYELYWRFYGLSHWLCDAASSTSVWLTVSFTIERYIAVCHPMKGKYFCTENRAKTVTVIVYIFCLLTTASTTFEYQLNLNDTVTCFECKNDTKLYNNSAYTGFFNNTTTIHYVPNNMVLTKGNHTQNGHNISTIQVSNDPNLTATLKNILANCTSNHAHIIYVYPQVINITHERSIPENAKVERLPNMTILHHYVKDSAVEELPNHGRDKNVGLPDDGGDNETGNATHVTIKPCCNITKLFIDVESTNLGKNESYTSIMYWYSALVFGIIPLLLIGTFNCFLVRAVYLSQRKRRTLTNSKKSHHNSQENVSVSNENRITMMLIAVVVMFLICQTPTASYLIYYSFYPSLTKPEVNIQTTLGNVFNFLISVNASCNFLLYSIMSKKFRSTFKQLFFERGKKQRQDTIALSSTKSHNNSQKFNPYHHGIKRNASEYHTPRNLETTSLTSAPRSKSLLTRPIGNAKSTDLIV